MPHPTPAVSSIAARERTTLEDRLSYYPGLKAKIESLLSVVEQAEGDMVKADEAEQRVIDKIRQLGQAVLQEWAQQQNDRQSERFLQDNPQAHRTRKNASIGTVSLAGSKL
jgi:hypothetical protein